MLFYYLLKQKKEESQARRGGACQLLILNGVVRRKRVFCYVCLPFTFQLKFCLSHELLCLRGAFSNLKLSPKKKEINIKIL